MKTLLFLLCFVSYTLAFAQYNINWVEAPLNEIPIKYKKEHFNLKGPIKTYQFYRTTTFDKEGYLIYGVFGSNFEFTYNQNHKLISTSSWLGDAFKPLYPLVLDAKGRIIEKKVFNNSEIYTYDANGNWTGTIDQYGNRIVNSFIYNYDTKNRVIKAEYYDYQFKVAWEETYTYAKDGDFVVVTKTNTNFKDASKNYRDVVYYKNGYWYGWVKNDNVKYDRYGNIINGVDKDGKVNMMSTYKYDYYGDVGVTDTFERDIKQKTTATKDPNCTEGNCINGYGVYEFDNGTYVGFFVNGKREGYGSYVWDSGSKFVGDWKNGIIDGYGIVNFSNGSWQKGVFKNAKLQGLGTEYFKDTNTAQYGIFENGKLITKYNYFKNTQNTDKGCLIGDCTNGYGQYIYDNGSKYIGFYKDGYMLQGTWYASNGFIYDGQFGEGNKYNGYGSYTKVNGEGYFGCFINGQRNGKGVLFNKNTNSIKKGEWIDDVLINEY